LSTAPARSTAAEEEGGRDDDEGEQTCGQHRPVRNRDHEEEQRVETEEDVGEGGRGTVADAGEERNE